MDSHESSHDLSVDPHQLPSQQLCNRCRKVSDRRHHSRSTTRFNHYRQTVRRLRTCWRVDAQVRVVARLVLALSGAALTPAVPSGADRTCDVHRASKGRVLGLGSGLRSALLC